MRKRSLSLLQIMKIQICFAFLQSDLVRHSLENVLTAKDLMGLCRWQVDTGLCYSHMSQRMTKPTKWHVHPVITQISLGRPGCSESSLSTWRKLGSLDTHWVHSEDWSDWADAQADLSSLGAHAILKVLSCAGSYDMMTFSSCLIGSHENC